MDIDEIRRYRMGLLEVEAGNPVIAARTAGMSEVQWRNLKAGAKDSKTGKPRGMRPATARRIEAAFKKSRNWLDERPINPDPEQDRAMQIVELYKTTPLSRVEHELVCFFRGTDDRGRESILSVASREYEAFAARTGTKEQPMPECGQG